jgi:DNA-binding NarL/FixJ family response regulator
LTGQVVIDRVLTARELEILKLIADGMSNPEIAAELSITPSTVKTHVAHLLAKLEARDRAHAVARALRDGRIE